MPDNVSALPTSMQSMRRALENNNTPPVESTPPTPPSEAAPTTPAPSSDTESKVTISREEFNELQADAGKARAAQGRAESLALDVEALTRRLTELEDASKGNPKPVQSAPAADTWKPRAVEFSEQENTDYGESKSFVRKVVLEVLNEEFPKLAAALDSKLGEVKTIAEGASKTAAGVKSKTYTDQVKDKVSDFDKCVNHKHWRDFTESTDPDTGFTYAELITNNFNRENVAGMVRVFEKFKNKYNVGKTVTTGYEGGAPTGSGGNDTTPNRPEKLPFSKRKEAHKKYIAQQISYEEYEKVRKEYEVADQEGRVDYDK